MQNKKFWLLSVSTFAVAAFLAVACATVDPDDSSSLSSDSSSDSSESSSSDSSSSGAAFSYINSDFSKGLTAAVILPKPSVL